MREGSEIRMRYRLEKRRRGRSVGRSQKKEGLPVPAPETKTSSEPFVCRQISGPYQRNEIENGTSSQLLSSSRNIDRKDDGGDIQW
jgi:hypothetical protein